MSKKELTEKLRVLRKELEALIKEMENFEFDPYDYEEQYKEALDSEGTVKVCGMEFEPSRILEELDPIAYRCGLLDFVDTIDIEDNPQYQELDEKREDLEAEIEDIEEELETIED